MGTAPAPSYEAFVAEYYDYLPIIKGRADVAFYVEFAGQHGGPILELGCGTGRILLPLASAGHNITGLDLSPHMLARCRAKLGAYAHEVQDRVQLVEGSMTGFELGRTFRLIFIPFRPFQHLRSVDDQIACLRAVHRHLEAGGKFVLDFFHTDPRRMHDPAYLEESAQHEEGKLPDGRRVRLAERTVAFHRAAQVNDVELIYYVTHPDERTERLVHAFSVRYFFRYEVEHLLARCGFRVGGLFGNFDRSPLSDASAEMLFVAEKTG